MKVVDVMTRNVVSVKLDSSVFEAAHLMIRNRISGLPVLDTSGKLVDVGCRRLPPVALDREGLTQVRVAFVAAASTHCAARNRCNPAPRLFAAPVSLATLQPTRRRVRQ
jgi:CBS domain-containing protein